ncbi:MAG: hypothetical protein EXQ85_06455 [Alphaproteobacteria bacterium]|nr:hypothetical protein [Alphaproteobacteria bacterium]
MMDAVTLSDRPFDKAAGKMKQGGGKMSIDGVTRVRPWRTARAVAASAACLALIWGGATAASAETIRVGVKSMPPSKGNPTTGRGIPSIFVWSAPFDHLAEIDGEGKVFPGLASSWEVKDPTTWQFKIRPNVTFSDGERLDAAAVKAVFDWLASEKGAATLTAKQVNPFISSVSVVDAMTVQFKTSAPLPVLDKRLTAVSIVSPKAWNDRGVEGFTQKPEGTGSFRVTEFRPDGADAVGLPRS